MKWTRVSMHKVILAWLRGERNSGLAVMLSQSYLQSPELSKLLDRADLNDPDENRARLRLFYLYRSVYFLEIPPDTEWFEVHNLTDNELEELHVVNFADWNDPSDKNELAKVAARKNKPLDAPPSNWEPPILWGHNWQGPFTIIEGNHRLAAYAASGLSGLSTPVFVGLSPMACVWHIFDDCKLMMQDLIIGRSQ
jgi:hypothetical protein